MFQRCCVSGGRGLGVEGGGQTGNGPEAEVPSNNGAFPTTTTTAWAFATAISSDAQVFAALARAAELRLSDFNVQALANTAWAFAMAAQSDAELFRALARAAGCCVGVFHA